MNCEFPISLLLCGKSGSGKTEWIKSLLKNQFISSKKNICRIIVCYLDDNSTETYSHISTLFPNLSEEVHYVQNKIPEYDKLDSKGTLIILDDLMHNAFDDINVAKLFTSGRHKNISVFITSQNLFPPGKHSRTISLNALIIVLFKMRDEKQIRILGSQLGKIDLILSAYKKCMEYFKYGYLLIDCRPNIDENLFLKTNIFKEIPSLPMLGFRDKKFLC